jgi:hypothetical protein
LKKATFTKHAFSRVRDRLNLRKRHVAYILDNDLCIPIGIEEGSSRVHRLFFSKKDGCCFVAVQDESNGEVVTILPVDYHKRWQVSLQATEDAKKLACRPSEPQGVPVKYIFTAFVDNPSGGGYSMVNLGSMPIQEGDDIESIIIDSLVHDMVIRRLEAKVNLDERECQEITMKVGKKGQHVPMPIPRLEK